MDYKCRPHVYPFLFAAWPVLQLYAMNSDLLLFSQVVLFLIAVLVICLALQLGLGFLLKDSIKVGLLVSFLSFMFFLYGHVEFVLYFLYSQAVRNVLIPVWFGILGAGMFAIVRSRRIPHAITLPANVVGVVLLGFPLVGVVASVKSDAASADLSVSESALIDAGALELSPGSRPDIYYIILDEYGRADQLQASYGYDNGEFIEALTERGLYVADESHSNYGLTFVSLASSLNMMYVQELSESPIGTAGYFELVVNNTVTRALKEMGYSYIHIDSGWGPTDRPRGADIEFRYRGAGYDNFSGVLMRTTMLNAIYPNVLSENHKRHILGSFEQIGDVAAMDGPTFVMAHLVVPHPPYVFRADGSAVPPREVGEMLIYWWGEENDSAYIDQVIFTNTLVESLIDRLLAESEGPPIIIIQSDHGTKPDRTATFDVAAAERLPILNAYYLPDGGDELLYPSITPVNSFRVVFNHYFDANIDLQDDHSYYSTYGRPESFREWPE